ncbi:MAG: ferredoxin [Ilumatobacteraceae bacterium]
MTVDDAPNPVRVRTHPSLCNGWGQCARWAPDVYTLDADGYIDVHVVDVPPEHAESAELGAIACPERAISILRSAAE